MLLIGCRLKNLACRWDILHRWGGNEPRTPMPAWYTALPFKCSFVRKLWLEMNLSWSFSHLPWGGYTWWNKQLDSLGVHHWKSLFLTWHLWFHLLNCFQISDGLGKFHLHFLANWGTVKFTWALRTYSLTDLEAGGMWENPPADWNLTTSVHWMVFHSLQLS